MKFTSQIFQFRVANYDALRDKLFSGPKVVYLFGYSTMPAVAVL